MTIHPLGSIIINFVNKELVTASNSDKVSLYNNLREYTEKFEEAACMLEVYNPEQLWISINNDHLVIKCLDDMNRSQLVSILSQCDKNDNNAQYRYALHLLHQMEFASHSQEKKVESSTPPSRTKVNVNSSTPPSKIKVNVNSSSFNRFDESDARFPWD